MDENTPKTRTMPPHNKYRKAKYTTQDVRQKAIEARDELLANIDFLMEVIREDRYTLKRYKEKHGDLRYRPIVSHGSDDGTIEPKYGQPTELVLEPVASKYRATVKSLFDSINLINHSILPEDNPEGESSLESLESNKSLRDEFKTLSANPKAFKPSEPQSQDDTNEELIPKAKQSLVDHSPAKSWRDTTPKHSKPIPKRNNVASEPKSKIETITKSEANEPKGLSPLMRQRLNGSSVSRLDALKAKYDRDDDDGSED